MTLGDILGNRVQEGLVTASAWLAAAKRPGRSCASAKG